MAEKTKVRKQASAEQVWIALAHCYRGMSLQIEESFAGQGLSLTDFMALEALLHKGPLTITQIQAAALLATGSMTVVVDRLEARGWIVRTMSKADRRARVLELTEAGRALIEELYVEHRSQLRGWMQGLSADERTGMFAGLRKMEKGLRDR